MNICSIPGDLVELPRFCDLKYISLVVLVSEISHFL